MMRKIVLSAALATALPLISAVAQPAYVATGVPHVGTSGGPVCNSVTIGTGPSALQMAVPNSDANAAAFLADLKGAEDRQQVIHAVAPGPVVPLGASGSDLYYTQCGALMNPAGDGAPLPHLIAYN